MKLDKSKSILQHNKKFIPGGVVSVNRAVEPEIAFRSGKGSRIWDADGNEYIDYHAAFGPHILGHNHPDVNAKVTEVMEKEITLMGSGTNTLEGRLAELIVRYVPSVEKVQITNSGSEATYHALRLARAFTGKDGVIVMQGGYNGWHNDVACNVMTPLEEVGHRVSPGEYPVIPLSAGVPNHIFPDIHVVNFNDLDSVEYVVKRYSIAALILEPILQNIGVVRPKSGYLKGLRDICDKHDIILIFDEVKTGFRHAIGGYQSICGVEPDISVFGKAIANGYPLAAIGGKEEIMKLFVHSEPSQRVMIAGTYNAHPICCAAAIATIENLASSDCAAYKKLDEMGKKMEEGVEAIFADFDITAQVSRQSSAFCTYFMDHPPLDWHDIASNHDFELDVAYRRALIDEGVYHFPVATKQGSISTAHTEEDLALTMERTEKAIRKLIEAGKFFL